MSEERAVIYARHSPRPERGGPSQSSDRQLEHCRKWCSKRGIEVVAEYADRGVSGAKLERPGLWGAVATVADGKANLLIVYRRDRLSREVLGGEVIRHEIERHNGRIVATDGDVDGDGPEVVMIRQILAAVAEYERKLIGIRTSMAMRALSAKGRTFGHTAPYGFEMIYEADGKPGRVPKPGEYETRNKIVEMYNKGYSISELVTIANKYKSRFKQRQSGKAKRLRYWYYSNIRAILNLADLTGELTRPLESRPARMRKGPRALKRVEKTEA